MVSTYNLIKSFTDDDSILGRRFIPSCCLTKNFRGHLILSRELNLASCKCFISAVGASAYSR